jgi:hypothetical protein
MNPDVAGAIPDLVADGVLAAQPAARLLRVAKGELLSARAELRGMLYLAVLLITGGVGIFVQQHLQQIGPLAIIVALGLATAAAFVWVARKAPPFAWGRVASPNLAFDYILLLGVLLAATDLGLAEANLVAPGDHRPWHLLIVAALAGAAAVRFDSAVVFSLALSTFAAWRGLAIGNILSGPGDAWVPALRGNAVACGVLFALLGLGMALTRRKAHFEPAAVYLGWLLILTGVASGMFGDHGAAHAAALVAVSIALAAGAWWRRRFPLFAFGVLGCSAGALRLLLSGPWAPSLGCFIVSFWSVGVVVALLLAHRQLKVPA